VASNHLIGGWSAERQQNKRVNVTRIPSPELGVRVAERVRRRLKNTPLRGLHSVVISCRPSRLDKPVKRSNPTQIANFIGALKAGDCFPRFIHRPHFIECGCALEAA
jgi:hypothetical protein